MVALQGAAQADVDPRGYLLAKKGAASPAGPTFFTDEARVRAAAVSAIPTARSAVVLTKDRDVFEQFVKLQWLLDTHYRGMLLADLYVAYPLTFVSHELRKDVPHVDEFIVGDRSLLIERPPG